MLRALGATVHVCPTAVAPDHPESYYSVAENLIRKLKTVSGAISMIT